MSITIDDDQVLQALNRLQQRTTRLRPAFKAIGEAMVASTHDRFQDKEAPDGTPWAPLSEATAARKGHDRILEGESGQLARQISYEATDDALEWGSPMVYATMMHFGGDQADFPHLWGDIPGRPFLGVSQDDQEEILDVLSGYLRGDFG
ncbi:phage virion morphogenesis protein [Chromohalobacter israelensis]|uniref:phage virion morphogenesis protein n=1 Tax=Chromohalobacter israelensis TaxID=141390 RepID=UPI00265C5A9A|nr:phage virion morphogenesis protein [Chromohalobacter salexigens]MDO0944649.1 phage virion morphogenesis protein [Chromohalobacter salexigens]